ncbi:MAG: hypothetical protein AB7H96_14335 [Vicinamibacterales bacterium]
MVAPPGLTRDDSLFAMLDGQVIEGRRGTWRAEVVSILSEPTQTWVQIGPAQRPAMSVLLRLGLGQRAEQALAALRAWTDLPEEHRPWRIDLGLRR